LRQPEKNLFRHFNDSAENPLKISIRFNQTTDFPSESRNINLITFYLIVKVNQKLLDLLSPRRFTGYFAVPLVTILRLLSMPKPF